MIIEKNGKFYTVQENKNSWTVTSKADKVEISYRIEKTLCPTFDALKAYILSNALF